MHLFLGLVACVGTSLIADPIFETIQFTQKTTGFARAILDHGGTRRFRVRQCGLEMRIYDFETAGTQAFFNVILQRNELSAGIHGLSVPLSKEHASAGFFQKPFQYRSGDKWGSVEVDYKPWKLRIELLELVENRWNIFKPFSLFHSKAEIYFESFSHKVKSITYRSTKRSAPSAEEVYRVAPREWERVQCSAPFIETRNYLNL